MRRGAWGLAAAAAAAGWLGCAPEPPPGDNVLLLVADDLGVEKVGAYGRPGAPPTPNIDALAARGVLFEHGYSAPSCSPSRGALLTGRHPRRYGLGGQLKTDRDAYELPLSERTLPELLDASPLGYSNSAVGKWHLATFLSPSAGRHPLLCGFDWYAGSFANFQITSEPTSERRGYMHWEKDTNGVFSWVDVYATSDTVDDALARIEAMPEPWLLWVAFNAVHLPLHDPPAHLYTRPPPTSPSERFDAMVEALDTEIGRLLDSIDPGVLARTTVVFVGDNGTPDWRLVSRGDPARRLPAARRRALARGKGTLYEHGIHVPFIVAGPRVARPGTRSNALVHLVDVLPTVAEIAGVDPQAPGPGGARVVIDGISLLPYLRDPRAPSRRGVLFQDQFGPSGPGPYQLDRRMLRDERYKLIEFALDARYELFDLAGGGEEGPDLFLAMDPERRAVFERLRRTLAETLAAIEAGLPTPAGG